MGFHKKGNTIKKDFCDQFSYCFIRQQNMRWSLVLWLLKFKFLNIWTAVKLNLNSLTHKHEDKYKKINKLKIFHYNLILLPKIV